MTDATRKNGRDTGAKARTVALIILAALAIIAALVLGRDLLIPIFLALLFTALLRPAVRALERLRFSTLLATAVVILLALGVMGGVVLAVEQPIAEFAHQIPATIGKARQRIEHLRRPLRRLQRVTEQVQRAAAGTDSAKGQPGGPGAQAPQAQVSGPGEGTKAVARVFGTTAFVLSQLVEIVVLAFFLLATGPKFLDRLVAAIPSRRDKQKTALAIHEIEAATAHYMLATAAINLGQGVCVALAVWALRMPSPWLWGALTFVFEFIPYLGGLAMIILLGAVGLATFDEPLRILAPPLAYLAITTLQNNIVSPLAYGSRLKLNPVVLLVAVLFWWEIWGVAGAFIAVPLMAAARIVCLRSDRLKPLALLLGD